VVVAGRSHTGFNPASGADVKLFGAVLDGNHLVRGFRNAEIREALYGSTEDAGQRRRQSHAVGRLLKRLRHCAKITSADCGRMRLSSSCCFQGGNAYEQGEYLG